MHQIGHITIKNYRSCRNVSLPLHGFTPLVGQNNSGKSTILDAIKWVLKPSAPSLGDFSDSNAAIEVCARIDGITTELLDSLPEQKHRKAIEPFCKNSFLWIKVSASGTSSRNIKQEVFDHEAYGGNGIPDSWREYPTGLPQAISAILPEPLHVEAMEDIGEDLGKAKAGTTIKALLDEVMGPILKAHEDLTGALATIESILTTSGGNRSEHLKAFDKDASSALEKFFPDLSLNLDLQVMEAKEFFKAGDLCVIDKITGDRRRFDEMGAGAQRAIQMALIRYLADASVNTSNKTARRLLLIDEPELYLHPQGVRRLRQALFDLSKTGFQVIFSTHSPLMLSRENAADTVVVGKTAVDGTVTRSPLRNAIMSSLTDGEAQARTLFELGNVAEIYFSEHVVLCEGKTDRRLLPLAYERLYGRHPELDHICFVAVGACSDIPKALAVLRAMKIKSSAVADLDFAFTEARKGSSPLLPKDGSDLQEAKKLLQRLKEVHGFPLADHGLPTNNKKINWSAADTWSLFAEDPDGQEIATVVHNALKSNCVWVWPRGCIEQVTGYSDKGEDAIIEQEKILQSMSSSQLAKEMPLFRKCFEWIREFQVQR